MQGPAFVIGDIAFGPHIGGVPVSLAGVVIGKAKGRSGSDKSKAHFLMGGSARIAWQRETNSSWSYNRNRMDGNRIAAIMMPCKAFVR